MIATNSGVSPTIRKSKTQIFEAADFQEARAFSQMTCKEQKQFIQRRFANIESAELINIVKAIYGHPHDKGRPRRSSSSTGVLTSSPAVLPVLRKQA